MINLRILCFLIFHLITISVSKTDTNKNYRLPQTIIPSLYNIDIEMHSDAFQTQKFIGTVTIELKVENSTKTIQLHSSNLEISYIDIIQEQKSLPYTDFQIDNETEILTITMKENLKTDAVLHLKIGYVGTLSDENMNGFYRSSYHDSKGNLEYLAITQFETVYARRAFPCFDEPKFKAPFILTVTHPREYEVISNTRVDTASNHTDYLVTVTFEKTPVMSTYTLAFMVSKLSPAKDTDDFTIWTELEHLFYHQIALEQGPKLLDNLGKFTGIKYKDLGIDKMDIAAIPDFSAGAMENWALVTFREILIIDDNDTSSLNQQNIILTLAHEFAHMWFGNYVTMKWWSDAWLNEGFATFMEYFIADQVIPEYEFNKQFLINIQQDVFQIDSLNSSQPVSSKEEDINTTTEIFNKFSLISYSKGACILRMIQSFLDDEFQAGITEYLKSNAWDNTTPENFWAAIDKQKPSLPNSLKMSEIMENWINNPGYPIVKVSLSKGKINMSQKRYIFGDSQDNTRWYIPITYTLPNRKNRFTDTNQWILMNKTLTLNETIDKNTWIIVNNKATGYYRVNYDSELWKRIIAALKKNQFDKITDLNRAQIIDDIFNLAKINEVPYKTAFELSEYLSNETNYYPWSSAFNSFSFLIKRTGSSELGQAISNKVIKLMDKFYKGSTKSDTHIGTLTKILAFQWGCYFGIDDCIKKSIKDFENYKKNSIKKPDSNYRYVIYCTALRHSKNPQKDWDFLWTKYNETTSSAEKNTILLALGCVKDSEIINNYLNKSIDSKSGVRKQDGFTIIKSVYSSNFEGVDLAYNFIKNNHDKLAEYYKGSNSLFNMLTGVADLFTTESQVTDLQKFVENESLAEDFKLVAQQALDKANANLNWFKSYKEQLDDIFGIDDGGDDNNGASNGILIDFPLLLFSLLICVCNLWK